MNTRALGFSLGATVLLAAAGCAHDQINARNDGNAGTPPAATANIGQVGPGQDATAADESNGAGDDGGEGTIATNDSNALDRAATDLNGGATDEDAGTPDNTATGVSQASSTESASPSVAVATNAPAAGDPAGTPGSDSGADTSGASASQQKNSIIASADGSQPGVIQQYGNGTLTLATSGHHHKKAHTMAIGSDVPVFLGDARVSAESLVPGTDVRVYYRNPTSGTEKQVVGVEIVSGADNGASGSSRTGATPDQNPQNPSDKGDPSGDQGADNPSGGGQ